MMSATSSYSLLPKPRVARALVPMRRPEATLAGRGSNGTVLRLMVIAALCEQVFALFAVHFAVA